MPDTYIAPLKQLVSRRITGIEVLNAYFQLVFGDARLSVINRCRVVNASGSIESGSPDFETALNGLIGRRVVSVLVVADEQLRLDLEPKCSVIVSLRPDDFVAGPEAAIVQVGHEWDVL
jgi:hypothetical protein